MSLRAPVKIDGQAAAACGLCVLAMAYDYGSIEPSTSTQNSSLLSRALSPSTSATPMSTGSSSIGLGFGEKEKEKAHLGFTGFAEMLDPLICLLSP